MFRTALAAAIALTCAAGAATTSTLVAGPFEIDIPESFAGCTNFFLNDQNPDRPGMQVFVNVFEETANNYKFADGSFKGHLVVRTTGAEDRNGKPQVIAETRGSRHAYSQFGVNAFVNNGILLVPGNASEVDPGNHPANYRLTVFTINFEDQVGCSRAPLEEVEDVFHGECLADFNQDGGVTGEDVYDFMQAWEHAMPSADCNGDNCISEADVAYFLAPWENGAC